MKVVILAGGLGTRISEESHLRPKPMIEIGGKPILWHIMKYYSCFGFNEFIICLGYKQYMIKEYFNDYFLHSSDVEMNLGDGSIKYLNKKAENWKVTLIDTGLNTLTGGRIKRVKDYIDGDTFMLTYGDGVCNVDLKKELEFHKMHGKFMTLTTVSIAQQKGVMEFDDKGKVTAFREKELMDQAIVNGGYMIADKKIIDYIDGDNVALEQEPFTNLVKDGQMMSFRHEGFWQCMDTQREMKYLCELWDSNKAPWKIW